MRILSWNKGAHEIFGYTEMEVIGQHITKIIPQNHGESHDRIEGDTIAILEKPTEMLGLKKDGTHFPMEILLTSWSMDEESFYTVFIRDITLRKLVESKIKSSLNEKEVLLKEIHHRV